MGGKKGRSGQSTYREEKNNGQNSCQPLQPWRKILFGPLSISIAFVSQARVTRWEHRSPLRYCSSPPLSAHISLKVLPPVILAQAEKRIGRICIYVAISVMWVQFLHFKYYIKWSLKRGESRWQSTFYFFRRYANPLTHSYTCVRCYLRPRHERVLRLSRTEHGSPQKGPIWHEHRQLWGSSLSSGSCVSVSDHPVAAFIAVTKINSQPHWKMMTALSAELLEENPLLLRKWVIMKKQRQGLWGNPLRQNPTLHMAWRLSSYGMTPGPSCSASSPSLHPDPPSALCYFTSTKLKFFVHQSLSWEKVLLE